jgi:glycosyltransferase involved in cell wall biosynthesis
MRIAYLGQMADITTENGISKKIRMQTVAWAAAGHVVRYFASVPRPPAWSGLAPLEADLIRRGNALEQILCSRTLCQHIDSWQPDVIYFRFAHHSPGLPGLFSRYPTIAEINSDDLQEYDLTLSAPKRVYHRMTRERVLCQVRGFVAVTSELAKRFSGFAKPTEIIGNSIDFAALPILPVATPDCRIRLIFVGNTGTPWHGLERVDDLAGMFPEYEFVVIGCTPRDYLGCPGVRNVPPNLQLVGMMAQQEYLPLLTNATAAIGTLGLYRKHMDEACPLKVREYLALGLPVIGAYQDTDIPPKADYFLRLPNDAEPLAPWRERIAAFMEHWRTRRVPRSGIAHLDVSVKEAQRLAFMAQIVAASRHG